MLLIPAIDVRAGRCVGLHQGDFASETHYSVEAEELLSRYHALGARWLHIVDLDGAKEGVPLNMPLVARLARDPTARLQVGGGVRSAYVVEALLSVGVARVVVGSAAIARPVEVVRWLQRLGAERLCLAFDVRLDSKGEPRVRTNGWTQDGGVALWKALSLYRAVDLRHVLCTDTARDGALTGPNLALYREAVERFPNLRWQASGGVRDAADLAALARIGVAASVCGKALHENRMTPEELRPFLLDGSSPASTCATVWS
jgi:phosphoribosylformimino-5-aminoimidazole carboxamide ribotide isomerase